MKLATILIHCLVLALGANAAAKKPNIIFILADDLGYGDVGVFFQNQQRAANNRSEPWHMTPQLDRMAGDGIQLRDHYCPAPVCAPSRASLLLGLHQGHSNVRDNQFDKALENNHTLATVLKSAGYATAAIGKWGLQGGPKEGSAEWEKSGPAQWPGYPTKRGFDFYFGYVRHRDGHWHYPKEDGRQLWENDREISADLAGCYTADLFTARAKKWISDHRAAHVAQPFFMYLAFDTPHAKLQLPPGEYPKGGLQWLGTPGRMINSADGKPDSYYHPDYANATWDHDRNPATPEQPWPDVYKRFATDVRRIDDCVADLLQLLKDLKIDKDTLVVFTSDNGPSRESYLPENYEPTFFNSFGPHDGIKRDCWEGGVRVGAIVRWPGKIPAGRTSREPSQSHDWMATFAEVAGVPCPARSDGVSLVPTLTGKGTQKPSRVYVEYFEGGKTPAYEEFAKNHRGRARKQMQMLRIGEYVGVRYNITNHAAPFEIYNVIKDPRETNNLAVDPKFKKLQQEMRDTVLQIRMPSLEAKRPYDSEFVPPVISESFTNGIEWRLFWNKFLFVPNFDQMKPFVSEKGEKFPNNQYKATTASLYTGFIEAPTAAEYTFYISRGNGVVLKLHEATVVDGDKGRPESEVKGTIGLAAGKHPFRLYYLSGSDRAPTIEWSSAEMPRAEIPANALFRLK